MALIAFLMALVAGAANPFQSATNAELNKQLHQPVWTALTVYIVGLVGVALIQLVVREPLPIQSAGGAPWWAWMGGLVSIIATMIGLLLAQKLGSGLFTGLSLTASVITSVLLDHFGLVGLKQHTASPGRLLGCVLLVGGIWLVAKY